MRVHLISLDRTPERFNAFATVNRHPADVTRPKSEPTNSTVQHAG